MTPALLSRACIPLAFCAFLGCSSEDEFTADVAGKYTVALTNGPTTCDIQSWMEGKSTTGVGLEITQTGKDVHATVDAISGIVLSLLIGSAEFDGTVSKSSFTLTAYGTRSQTAGSCAFTYNAKIDGTLEGDAIHGTVTYYPATNQNPSCANVTCQATQEFSGSRPPH